MDSEQGEAIVFIRGDLSKHEIIFVRTLAKVGAKILIVSKNTKIEDNFGLKIQNIVYNTNEQLKIDAKQVNNTVSVNIKHYNSLEDIELALYEKNETVKVIVIGMNEYDTTCNFYAKLYNELNNNTDKLFFEHGVPKPSYEATSKIQRFNSDKHEYIISTLCNYVNCYNENMIETIRACIKDIYSSREYATISGQQLYNKIVYTICVLNELLKNKVSSIVFYGRLSKNDETVLEILSKIEDLTIIVVCSDKKYSIKVKGINTLELDNSNDIFPVPTIDKRTEAYTMAAKVQNVVDNTLFNGDTLGLYKPGMFNTCDYINFNTTIAEIELWWNKDVYLRPGFKVEGTKTIIPTYFKIINGTDGSKDDYLKTVSKYLYGKTVLCKNANDLNNLFNKSNVTIRHLTDMNGTPFEQQKPFVEHYKLQYDRIKNGINFPYRLLEFSKQQHILNKMQNIMDMHDKLSINDFESTVLKVGLSLDISVVNLVQWFEFYGINPNIVVIWQEHDILNKEQIVLLLLLRELGFDILLFVPSCYNVIEDRLLGWYNYSADKIGDADFNVDTHVLSVKEDINNFLEENKNTKKKGLLNKLFNRN